MVVRPVLGLVIALCVPACQVVFPLEDAIDKVPHIRSTDNEEPGDGEFLLPRSGMTTFEYDTTNVTQPLAGVSFEKLKQDTTESADVVVMRVDTFTLVAGGTFNITGDTPILILARTVEIGGTLDASASTDGVRPGPGGGVPSIDGFGAGGGGILGRSAIQTGGGGGGFGTPGGAGGEAKCGEGVLGGVGGALHGDDELLVLRGGGAGGSGAARCPAITYRGGLGGGALQISATESITITSTGRIRASGGGGGLGAGGCGLRDDAGSGGGAGGAIYLDAPRIANDGVIEAHGGGGGGGGDETINGGNGMNGTTGHWGNEVAPVRPETTAMPSIGGTGQLDKGTNGGNGAHRDLGATAGATGTCAAQLTFNTGGGGGGFGRIVVRVAGEVSPVGTIEPPPTPISYPGGRN